LLASLLSSINPFYFVVKVLNIVAELKPIHRKEVIALLKHHGFRCLKYIEAYDMHFQCDHYMKIENSRLFFEKYGQSTPFYGIMCDEPPAGNRMMDTAEVRV
jgi:hypothetical protein